jgi:hypothetical protein
VALRDILVRFGVDFDQRPLEEGQRKTDNLLGTFQKGLSVLKSFGAALAVRELVGFVTETVAAADTVGDLAARLGLTTDQFQVLKALADDAGSSIGSVQTAFRTLAGSMKEGAAEFGSLGVATRNADGSLRSIEDVFFDVGGALSETQDQATRLQLAQKLLGRGGLELLPVFAGGADAVAKYRAELEETAIVFDEQFIEAADRTEKNLAALHHRFTRLKVLIVSQILPAFNMLVGWLEKGAVGVKKFVQSGKAMQMLMATGAALALQWAGGIRVGAALVGRLIPLVRTLGRFLVRFAIPVVILDELITLFRGGDTVIGRFIDKLFGVGAASAAVDLVKGAAQSLIDTLSVLLNAGSMTSDELEAAFMRASEGIGKAFDSLFEGLGQALSDFGEFFTLIGSQIWTSVTGTFGSAVDWVRAKFSELVASVPGLGGVLEAVGKFGGAAGAVTGGPITTPPMLSPASTANAAGAQVSAPVDVTNNITVGSATPATAREIGKQAGAATAAAAGGRDRAAIGAVFGVT